ncbi:MAG: carboxypeptidase regulatory-like domain-containing protein [Polyangia bacterium]
MEIASARRACWAVLVAGVLAGSAGCHRRPRKATPLEASASPAGVTAARLTGRVLDAAGHAVPDAAVLAFALDATQPGARAAVRATADVDGRFVLTAPAGTYRLLVEAAGFPVAARAPVEVPSAGVTLSVDGEGRTVSGTVSRDGAPADAATVRLAAEGGGPERRTRTGADGRFAVAGLGDGVYALRAEAAGAVSPTIRGLSASAAPGGPPVRLVLAPAAAIVGRVTADGAVPGAAVEVRAEDRALPPGEDPLPVVARTTGAGAFTLAPLPPGAFRVTATSAGFVLRKALTVEAGAPGQTAAKAAILLELLHGARLTGRVASATGAPLAGARIRCAGAEVDDLTVRAGTLPLAAEAAALPAGAVGTLGGAQTAVADARGHFALEGLLPGRYRLEVARDGYQPLAVEVTLGPGERREVGLVTLTEGFPVRGRVVNQTGAPIEGARVSVSAGAAGLPGAVTDAAGQFSVALAPGRYRITASAEGWGTASADTTAEAGGAQPLVELRLARADGTLEGLVRDDAGRPLAHARLAARPARAGSPALDSTVATATTDPGGHFRMPRLPGGELRIEVSHPDYPKITAPATAGQFATIVVPVPGGVMGEVRGRTTGALVPHARLEASGPDGATAAADTKTTGAFRLLHLAPGAWRIRASAPKMRPAEQQVDVPASPTLGEPSVRNLRIDLDPA